MTNLQLDGSKRFPSVKKLLAFAGTYCDIQPGKARQIIEEATDAVADTVPDLERHMKDYSQFAPTGESMMREWSVSIPKWEG